MSLLHRFDPLFFDDKKILRNSICSALARLDYIATNINAASLDQAKTAIGDIANYEKKLIKFVVNTERL